MRDRIINEYFEWLYDLICGKRYSQRISYRKLLSHLHSITFTYSIKHDVNRAEDGEALRYRYAMLHGFTDVPECLDAPCSVLEMMIALAVRCEETIMDDPNFGERTGQWFWLMIDNLGLSLMTDRKYDPDTVDKIVTRFLRREYEPDGTGGLFRIEDCVCDLREVQIWHQMCRFLDTIMYIM